MIYNLKTFRAVFTSLLERRKVSTTHHPASRTGRPKDLFISRKLLFSSLHQSQAIFLLILSSPSWNNSRFYVNSRQWRFICEKKTYPIDRLMFSQYPFLYQLNFVSDEPYAVHIKTKFSFSLSGSFCSDSRDCKKSWNRFLVNLQYSSV